MIARKPQKFSLNSGETNSEQLHKERASDFSDKPQQTKFASDTATSILEELGVKKTTSNKTNKNIKLGICGEHGGDPKSIKFCSRTGLNYVSCSPFRVPVARLAAAQAELSKQ